MNNGLSSRPAAAAIPGDVWGVSVEEEVVRPYLLDPHLHQQRAHSRAGLRKRFRAADPRAWVGRRKLDRLGTDTEDVDS